MRFSKSSRIQIWLLGGLILFITGSFYTRTNINNSQEYIISYSINSIEDSLLIDSIPNSVTHGEMVFNWTCQNCHSSRISHYKTAEEWTVVVDRMGKIAGIADSTLTNLHAFVQWKLERTDSKFRTRVIGGHGQW